MYEQTEMEPTEVETKTVDEHTEIKKSSVPVIRADGNGIYESRRRRRMMIYFSRMMTTR